MVFIKPTTKQQLPNLDQMAIRQFLALPPEQILQALRRGFADIAIGQYETPEPSNAAKRWRKEVRERQTTPSHVIKHIWVSVTPHHEPEYRNVVITSGSERHIIPFSDIAKPPAK